MHRLPRDNDDDYTREAAAARRQVVSAETGARLDHVAAFTFDPGVVSGNMEGFSGVAQVPLGFAGPLLVHGEHASGEYFVPLATTEGTLVASYSRGMRITREAGGITTTVIDDAMQRAPVFVFRDARAARDFGHWVDESFAAIKAKAEETTRFGKLRDIEQYALGRMRWLRFNFTTGDAAGQNMVTKAVHEACWWIIDQHPDGLEDFVLASLALRPILFLWDLRTDTVAGSSVGRSPWNWRCRGPASGGHTARRDDTPWWRPRRASRPCRDRPSLQWR